MLFLKANPKKVPKKFLLTSSKRAPRAFIVTKDTQSCQQWEGTLAVFLIEC